MSNYAIHTAEGTIVRVVSARPEDIDMQLRDGELVTECDARWHDRIDVATGTVIPQDEPQLDFGPAVAWARRKNYGSVEQQLGMLFDGMNEHGVPHPAFQKWFDMVSAVKTAIPKDATEIPDAVWTVEPIAPQEGDQ